MSYEVHNANQITFHTVLGGILQNSGLFQIVSEDTIVSNGKVFPRTIWKTVAHLGENEAFFSTHRIELKNEVMFTYRVDISQNSFGNPTDFGNCIPLSLSASFKIYVVKTNNLLIMIINGDAVASAFLAIGSLGAQSGSQHPILICPCVNASSYGYLLQASAILDAGAISTVFDGKPIFRSQSGAHCVRLAAHMFHEYETFDAGEVGGIIVSNPHNWQYYVDGTQFKLNLRFNKLIFYPYYIIITNVHNSIVDVFEDVPLSLCRSGLHDGVVLVDNENRLYVSHYPSGGYLRNINVKPKATEHIAFAVTIK